MPTKQDQRDPIAAQARNAIAHRRVGALAKCKCGESRPLALMRKRNGVVCASCEREQNGKAIIDNHHVAGRANSSTTIWIPVNDHRADLSEAQYEWPKKTLNNPDRSPLLAAAACIRGFINTVEYLTTQILLWIAEFMEELDDFMIERLGPKWWLDTPLRIFTPGGSHV